MSDPKLPAASPADAAAALWLARRDRGFTAAEQDEYLQWLRQDPRHGLAVVRLRRTWASLDALAQWRPAHSARPNPDLLAAPPRHRHWLAPAVFALAAAAALLFSLRPPPAGPAAASRPLVAAHYERRTLADGSVVELNQGAVLTVNFTPQERRVELVRGEAHFTVAKNPARPFVVQAGGVAIRAVGTAFNVRLAPDTVEVLVTEGKVRVGKPAEPAAELPLLVAGQRAVIATSDTAVQSVVAFVTPAEITTALAWQPKRLEFADAPLSGVVAEFNRHGAQQLVLGDERLASLRVGGNFRADNVEAFVRLLETGFGVKAERTPGRTVLRSAP